MAWRMATPTASCCGTSLAVLRVFLLTWCLHKNIDTLVWVKLMAFLVTAEDLASLESVVFGPWIIQRKELYSSFRRCSSSTSSRGLLNDQGWALLIALLSTDAASYKAFISASVLFSASCIAASLVRLLLTRSGSFACLALWNSSSGISLWRSFFNFGRLQVGFHWLTGCWFMSSGTHLWLYHPAWHRVSHCCLTQLLSRKHAQHFP